MRYRARFFVCQLPIGGGANYTGNCLESGGTYVRESEWANELEAAGFNGRILDEGTDLKRRRVLYFGTDRRVAM